MKVWPWYRYRWCPYCCDFSYLRCTGADFRRHLDTRHTPRHVVAVVPLALVGRGSVYPPVRGTAGPAVQADARVASRS